VDASEVRASYTNGLSLRMPDGTAADNCADPSVLRGRGRYAGHWYMYCTSDPLSDRETRNGVLTYHRLPMWSSRDLVHWTFKGSALPGRPAWATPSAKLWAPDVVYSSTYRRYYLTYAVTDTVPSLSHEPGCGQDAAIGVATSTSPVGPWRRMQGPLVGPIRLGKGCSFASTIDPDVLGQQVRTTSTLYWGGFRGGIRAQSVRLSRTGMRRTGSPHHVTTPQRYEGATVVSRGGYYYLFVSSGTCCDVAMSGYGVFAGRSRSRFGPFVDREGSSLLAARVGGTPVLATNGNRWVGPGHNTVFQDLGGRWWTVYHAIDRSRPSFAGHPRFTRRPPMLDPVDWVGGWPSVRSGLGPSDSAMPAPAAQPGQTSRYAATVVAPQGAGDVVPEASDELDGSTLDPRWTWVREPATSTWALDAGSLTMRTQAAGLSSTPRASVLTEPFPSDSFVVETAVRLDVPVTGNHDYVQAGLLLYGGDDRYVKLTHTSLGPVRVTELGTRYPASSALGAGSTVSTVGPPAPTTWLRLVVEARSDGHRYVTAYTSQDGRRWVRGATRQYDDLGANPRIGLAAFGGSGYTAAFDDVRVWKLAD
jgi:arabinan endo-1,5-alpha-L-arabinosidase